MPRPYPQQFRDDVVRVARNRDSGVTLEQIAADFGGHPITLSKWMRQAEVDDSAKPGTTTTGSARIRFTTASGTRWETVTHGAGTGETRQV